jgi:hypothetical protein
MTGVRFSYPAPDFQKFAKIQQASLKISDTMNSLKQTNARVVKLVDAPDSKSGSEKSVGSSPTLGTKTAVYSTMDSAVAF